MASITTAAHVHTSHCHHHGHTHTKTSRTLQILEKVSAIALGAFSAFTSWKLFLPFFFVGIAVGVFNDQQVGPTQVSPASACSAGVIEGLTGVSLPPALSLATNLAVTVCHIDHHSSVFVPIVGLSLGNWAGKTASVYYRNSVFA